VKVNGVASGGWEGKARMRVARYAPARVWARACSSYRLPISRSYSAGQPIGAAPGQAWRQLDWEALLTTLVGVAAGARVAQRPGWHLVVPGMLGATILGGAAALGLLSMVVPARLLARGSPAGE
jgi:hypothetical protein